MSSVGPNISLNLVVIRSADPERVVAFYRVLGLSFAREQHGTGPVHYACEMGRLVFEIYPQSEPQVLPETRLGFAVGQIADLIGGLEDTGVAVVQPPRETPWGLRAVVRDPDGRSIELIERLDASGGSSS